MKKVLVIHGPNLSLLGERQPEIYGSFSLEDINRQLKEEAERLGLEVDFFQSDHEGEIVAEIGASRKSGYGYLIINPAAYTHTSVAIPDAIDAVKIPTVEVHLSNIYAREPFRQKSFIAPVAKGQISGFGMHSYILALQAIAKGAVKSY